MESVIRPGVVFLAEVLPGKYRPAVVVNNFGNHSTIIPLRGVTEEDINVGVPTGQLYVNFYNNTAEGSIAQTDCMKSVPNLRLVKELGEMYATDVRAINNMIKFGGVICA